MGLEDRGDGGGGGGPVRKEESVHETSTVREMTFRRREDL